MTKFINNLSGKYFENPSETFVYNLVLGIQRVIPQIQYCKLDKNSKTGEIYRINFYNQFSKLLAFYNTNQDYDFNHPYTYYIETPKPFDFNYPTTIIPGMIRATRQEFNCKYVDIMIDGENEKFILRVDKDITLYT